MDANNYTKLISAIMVYLPALPHHRLIELFDQIKTEAIQRMTDSEEITESIKDEHRVFFRNDLTAPSFIQALIKGEKKS